MSREPLALEAITIVLINGTPFPSGERSDVPTAVSLLIIASRRLLSKRRARLDSTRLELDDDHAQRDHHHGHWPRQVRAEKSPLIPDTCPTPGL
jgi:hypothetical protein